MKPLTTVLTTLPMFLGLAAGQDPASTPRSTNETATMGNNGQTFVGILVDSKCVSSGAGSSMPRSTASSVNSSGMPRSSAGDAGSMLNRSTPAETGRAWNSTDHNTSGVADRTGTPASSATGDMNKTSSSRDTAASRDMNRNTPHTGAADDRSASAMARNTPPGSDTQVGNNDMNPNSPSDVAAVGKKAVAGSGNWDRSCFISPASSSFVLQMQDGRTVKIDDAGNSRISSQLQSTGRVSSMNKVFRVKITGSMEGDTIHITDIQM